MEGSLRWTLWHGDFRPLCDPRHRKDQFPNQSCDHITSHLTLWTWIFAFCFIFILNQSTLLDWLLLMIWPKAFSPLPQTSSRCTSNHRGAPPFEEHGTLKPHRVHYTCFCPWLHVCAIGSAWGRLAGHPRRDKCSAEASFKVTNLPSAESPRSVNSVQQRVRRYKDNLMITWSKRLMRRNLRK